jgi:glycerophosphoryl diester phosphodiesterase
VTRNIRIAGFVLAIAFLILTFVNASWLADEPKGSVKLIAHRGIYQQFDRRDVRRDTCTATRIEEPFHGYLENTVPSAVRAQKLGAAMIEVDILPTKDGEIALFHDWTLDCRSNGTGDARDATMAELKALDIAYGYSADGGKTFPLRGTGVGMVPSLDEMHAALPPRARLMFHFKADDPAEAEKLIAKLAEIGRDPVKRRDAFYGPAKPIAAIRKAYPDIWAWTKQEAKTCSTAYVAYGWSGIMPEACKGKTMVIPLNRQFVFWGWPNRLTARMEAHGGHIIVTGNDEDGAASGLTLPEQLGEIPASSNAYIWVEDSLNIVPALIQRFDNRTADEYEGGQAALKARRAAQ